MKINTKTATSVSPHSFETPNKYIPDGAAKSSNGQGREVLYETVVVSTPVFASARIHENQASSGQKRLLASDDVDALNDMLEKLYIGSSPASKTTTTTTTPPIKKEAVVKEEDECKNENDEQQEASSSFFLGRMFQSIYSAKTETHVVVKRSARLANHYN